jgi:CHAT domain-containing protein
VIGELLDRLEAAESEDRLQDDAPPGAGETRRARLREARDAVVHARPVLASLVSVEAASADEVRGLLAADETLVEYYAHEGDLFAFVLDQDGVSATRLDGASLAEDVAELRARVQDRRSFDPGGAAHALHRRLIAPLAAQLGPGPITVVPHGALHYLPFPALWDGSAYLVDTHPVRVLPSASLLRFLGGGTAAARQGLLAVGNPDLGDPRQALRFAEEESVAISRTRPESVVLLRRDATETAVRNLGGRFRQLHFATHGRFDAARPLDSGLLLAPDARHDGVLRVDEIFNLQLRADLVTLSACETGLGHVASGDDVIGLSRGFLYAGARSIVASLWSVDDRATSALMTSFYTRLEAGDRREALRRAQLDTRSRWAHPYYWAAFQLVGAPQ